MKNKMAWVLSIVLLCGAVTPIDANVKEGKEQIKEKKPKKHTIGCNCGEPPRPPKFWFWFSGK